MQQREMKFRVWSVKGTMWYLNSHGNTLEFISDAFGNISWRLTDDALGKNFICSWHDKGENKLMQYIGIKDMCDKEIYECDTYKATVLCSPDGISTAHGIYFWVEVLCVVVFKDGAFKGEYKIDNYIQGQYKVTNRHGFIDNINKDIQIIGNIFEGNEITK